jgi:starch phosphorylase
MMTKAQKNPHKTKKGRLSVMDMLHELASNFWWVWNPKAAKLFQKVSKSDWKQVKNPVWLLSRVKKEQQRKLNENHAFHRQVSAVYHEFMDYMLPGSAMGGTNKNMRSHGSGNAIVYFCSEYAIHESFPNYSGGLGVLAGDHIKTASDLNIPLTAIGLFYHSGFFEQMIEPREGQVEDFVPLDMRYLPLRLLKDGEEPLLIEVPIAERIVHAQVWLARVGRVKLYLLDTNTAKNNPEDRNITQTLYGGDTEHRIKQEMILGYGGSTLVRKLGIPADCYHMNEGHAAFSAVERLYHYVSRESLSLDQARELVQSTTVFTTHTPVPAGNQVYDEDLVKKTLSFIQDEIDWKLLLSLASEKGREGFAMTVLCLNLATWCNGVSRLHGHVSRQMWQSNWPLPAELVPITSVTNAIHLPTWIASPYRKLLEKDFQVKDELGRKEDWLSAVEGQTAWSNLDLVSSRKLWKIKGILKKKLIKYIRESELRRFKEGRSFYTRKEIYSLLDPEALTIGFARRFATYKRATLMFSDLQRLKKILSSARKPVQFIFAGKAHFHDEAGKKFLKKVVSMAQKKGLRGRIVFIENYNMEIGRLMVQGVDIWLNNPRRPHEASGTSGMKVPVNGGLNVSILDGWWPEAYTPATGWAISPGNKQLASEAKQDKLDSNSLYKLLEDEIVPLYYKRKKSLPEEWLGMVRSSMRTCVPMFHANRMLRDYLEHLYLPACRSNAWLSEGDYLNLKDVALRTQTWKKALPSINLISMESEAADSQGRTSLDPTVSYLPGSRLYRVNLDLAGLPSLDCRISLVSGSRGIVLESIDQSVFQASAAADFTPEYLVIVPGPWRSRSHERDLVWIREL